MGICLNPTSAPMSVLPHQVTLIEFIFELFIMIERVNAKIPRTEFTPGRWQSKMSILSAN